MPSTGSFSVRLSKAEPDVIFDGQIHSTVLEYELISMPDLLTWDKHYTMEYLEDAEIPR
jgi:hypothetical protein